MTATLVGATGLIGSYLLEQLLSDPYFDTIRILIRRPIDITHPKLEKKIVDFNDSDSLLVALSNSDVLFCSIGSTMKKVNGDKEAYRKIDSCFFSRCKFQKQELLSTFKRRNR
jgi:aspartate-semialdehyde dehydrogenase